MSANDSSTTREAKYIFTDVRANNNKFWQIQERINATCQINWGRVGGTGQAQTKQFGSQYEASNFFDSKCREKEQKGYEKLKVLDNKIAVVSSAINNQSLVEIATRQIKTDSPKTIDLIKRLAKENIHNILSQTTLSYDTSRGTFSTPLGIVTQDAVLSARSILARMVGFVRKQDFANLQYINLLNQYLRLVPQKVGRKLDAAIYPDIKSIQAQNDILDSLEASLQMIVTQTASTTEQQIFEAKLSLVEEGKAIDRVRNLYRATRQSLHACHNLDVKQIFSVEILPMKTAFESHGKQIGNIMELWHGTRIGNLLSILKTGFVIPPADAGHCTGRMFGNGIYCSDQSTKALNYSYGYWNGSTANNCFMFLNDVAMGRHYVPSSSGERLPKPGYDSTFAKANRSGVFNNEMIVYRLDQINPKFLVEFSTAR